ncbi:hypothetical protein N8455_00790 [Candidatus Gracilibacteria bacterium]|nr:hypothetical protein [Candidatus Gracilibacteria bacterium]
MTQKWKEIEEIDSVAELDFVWNELKSNERKEFQQDVLYYAHTQAHAEFMKWCKEKYNRYKYIDAMIHKNFIKWCKNCLYFTHFYILRASIAISTSPNEGDYTGLSINKKNVVCSFFLYIFILSA